MEFALSCVIAAAITVAWFTIRPEAFSTVTGSTTAAAALVGRASVIDGDTIEIHGDRIRLAGIDAPESDQTCRDAGGHVWHCGQRAALALSDKIGQATVHCEGNARDRYQRLLAVCKAANADLGAWLVREGLALAYRRYNNDYVSQEDAARAARRGLWGGTFEPPWDWRAQGGEQQLVQAEPQMVAPAPAPSEAQDAGSCLIKGNVSSKGERIYHMPGGRWYDETKISSSKGERWFCNEAEARAAGWRRSKQ